MSSPVFRAALRKRDTAMNNGCPEPTRLQLGTVLADRLLQEAKDMALVEDEVKTLEGAWLAGMRIEVIPLVNDGLFMAVA